MSPTDPSSFERLRPLGLLEQYSSARHSIDYYTNVAVSASYSIPTPVELLQPLIYRAVAAVIARHPSLSAIVVDEDTPAPYFVRIPRIHLPDSVEFVARKQSRPADGEHDIELDELLEGQHNRNFKQWYGELPFWRLAVLHDREDMTSFVACFVYHHALADGASGLSFHRSFLSALSETAPPTTTEELERSNWTIQPPNTRLIPNLESLHQLPISLSYLFSQLWTDWFPQTPPKLWTTPRLTPSPQTHHTRLRTHTLSAQTTTKLLAASRANSTTLTGTLEALVAAAIFANLPADKYSSTHSTGAMSLRRLLSADIVDDNSMGCFVSSYSSTHHRLSTSTTDLNPADLISWPAARAVRRTIETELAKSGRDTFVSLLRWAGDLHARFRKQAALPTKGGFEVSNLGVFRGVGGSDTGGWRIGRVVFSQSASVVKSALMTVSVVTGGDGRCGIGVSWLDEWVSQQWVEGVVGCLGRVAEEM